MIIDGTAIAREILQSVRARVETLGREPVLRAFVMSPTAATESYLRIKTQKAHEAGIRFELVRIENDASTAEVIEKVGLPGADALIVQLPLPSTVDQVQVLDAIPVALDADVLSGAAYARFEHGDTGALLPPVVAAVASILDGVQLKVRGKRAVVVGNGRLVGAPVRAWLERECAEVTVLTQENFAVEAPVLKEAELVVSGAGSPGLIKPEMLAPGVVCIDAGTSESSGAIVGDFDSACAEVASAFTPVPGGVGPVAVACLFANVARLLDGIA